MLRKRSSLVTGLLALCSILPLTYIITEQFKLVKLQPSVVSYPFVVLQPAGRTSLAIGKAAELNLSDEELDKLLTTPSPLHGFQNKTGPLNPTKWLPELDWWRRYSFNRWFEGIKNGDVDPQSQPFHVGSGCEVFVNHDYRYFWIKMLKTGSTAVDSSLGHACRNYVSGDKDTHHCSSFVGRKPLPSTGDPATWWMDYFVFTTVRNPYSRYASAYNYLRDRSYLNLTMGENCKNPFLVQQNESTWSRGSRQYIRHMMEQTSCLFTEKGGIAVDFIARTENMDEDFKIIVQEINKRRKSDLPPLKDAAPAIEKDNPDKKPNDTYAYLFKQYPHCIGMIEYTFRNEFEDLKYI